MPTRVSTEFVEHFDILAGSGRVSSEFVEHFDILAGTGRFYTQFAEVFYSYEPPVAFVPDIFGFTATPTTFNGAGSTGSIDLFQWKWTSIPVGSAIANLDPQPLPDNGGSSFVSMTSNQVVYHCDYIEGTPFPDNQAVTPIDMTSNVGLYHLNDNFLDSSGNNNHGKHNQPTQVAGKIGTSSYEFDGNDRLEFGNVFDFPTGDFSVSFWIYPGATQNSSAVVMSRTLTGNLDGWSFEQETTLLNRYRVSTSNANVRTFTTSTAALTANVWSHICIVRVTTNIRIYVNGALSINATNAAFGSIGSQPCTFSLGNHPSQHGVTQWWRGRIDELAVWSRALSAGEVSTIYTQQNAGTPFPDNGDITGWISMANNEGLYHFEGNYLDTSGNQRDGALYGPFRVAGKVGSYAYEFDRSFNWVESTDQINFSTTNFSVSLWVYPRAVQVNTSAIIGNQSATTLNGWILAQSGTSTNQYRFVSYNENALVTGTLFTLSANVWSHVCIVRVAGNVRVYVNGSLIVNDSFAGFATIGYSYALLTLGAYPSGFMSVNNFTNTRQFNGFLDEVAIWSRALTALEVSTIYTQQNAGTPFPDNGDTGGWISMANNELLYHLEGNFLDSSGYGRDGSSNGLVKGAKQIGTHGYSFPGFGPASLNNSFIELDNTFNFTTGDFSVCFWVFPEPTQSTSAPILSNLRTATIEGWSIEQFGANANRYYFGRRQAGVSTFSTATTALTSYSWSQICVTRSGSNVRIYVNGALQVNDTNALFATIGTTNNPLTVGNHPINYGTSLPWRGRLDELAIWSRVLSASEVTNIYRAQVGNYSLDSSGNLNDAKAAYLKPISGKVGISGLEYTRLLSTLELASPVSIAGGTYSACFWFYNLKPNTLRRAGLHSSGNLGYYPLAISASSDLVGVVNTAGVFTSANFSMTSAAYTGWHHICVVAQAGRTIYYVDGCRKGDLLSTPVENIASIGNRNSTLLAGQPWAERIDEVAIWNRALTPIEVATIYSAQYDSYAGFGSTFTFTPDVTGTYTVQLSASSVAICTTSTDLADAIITLPTTGIQLLQGNVFRFRYGHQGYAIRKNY